MDVRVVAAKFPCLAKLKVRASRNGLLRARALELWEENGHLRRAVLVDILLQQHPIVLGVATVEL